MSRGNNKLYVVLSFLLFWSIAAKAQTSSTSYFMDRTLHRHELNPSLVPEEDYFDLFIGHTFGQFSSNLTAKQLFFVKPDGQLTTGFNQDYHQQFLQGISANNHISAEINYSIFSTGWRRSSSYYTVGAALKAHAGTTLSKDMLAFALEAPNTDQPTTTSLVPLSAFGSTYAELAAGYSYRFTQSAQGLRIGAKLKLLLGLADARATYTQGDLYTSLDSTNLTAKGTFRYSSMYPLSLHSFNFGTPNYGNVISGLGLAFDFGAEYRMINDQLRFSLAVIDLGFLSWFRTAAVVGKTDVNINLPNFLDPEQAKAFQQEFIEAIKPKKDPLYIDGYTNMITAKILAGVEYAFAQDRVSVGLLYKATLAPIRTYQEVTLSCNYRPIREVALSASYSALLGGYSNIGFALNINPGPFNLFIAMDYIPLEWGAPAIPLSTSTLNVQFGIGWNLIEITPRTPKRQKLGRDRIIPPRSWRMYNGY